MKQRILFALVCVALLAITAGSANAGVYVGGAIGQGSADISAADLDDGSFTSREVNDTDTDWKVYGGWRLFRFFAVEAAYNDMGEVSAGGTSDGSGFVWAPGEVSQRASVDGISLATMGVLPLGKFDLFAKVGYLFWDADLTVVNDALQGGSVRGSEDGEDTLYGAGFVWNYTGPGALRLEYELGKIDQLDINSLSAGVTFMF